MPHHLPTQCPFLADLNLQLISGGGNAPPPSTALAPSPSASAPLGGLSVAVECSPPLASGGGSLAAPSGLTAVLASADAAPADFESDDDYHWEGDEYGLDYVPPPNLGW